MERARAIAKRLGVGLAIVDKRRTAPNEAEVMHVIGDVDGCNALIVDDIIDTAGTLTKTVDALKKKGARARPRRRHPRRALRAGAPAHRRLAPRARPDHQHHPGRGEALALAQAAAALGRPAAGRGDPPHPREQLGQLPVRLATWQPRNRGQRMDQMKIEVERREEKGKNANRRAALRAA